MQLYKIRLLFKRKSELVSRIRFPGKIPGAGRNSKKRRESFGFDSLFIGHELQPAQPAVTAVADESAADGLRVECHLGNAFAGTVLRH